MDGLARPYSPAVAAALSGLSVKGVHEAIAEGVVELPVGATETNGPLTFSAADVLRLKLLHDLGALLSVGRRKRLFDAIDRRPEAGRVKADSIVIVDVREARRQIASRARDLAAAESAVVSGVDVLGGEPVFEGTRIPVRTIAAMLDDGAAASEILDGYPKLTPRHLEFARLWSVAHPRHGRPESLSERGLHAVSRVRMALGTTVGKDVPSLPNGERPGRRRGRALPGP